MQRANAPFPKYRFASPSLSRQIGKQRDAERARVDERLRERRDGEYLQAPRHSADPRARTEDRAIDPAVRVIMPAVVLVPVALRLGGRGLLN